MDKSFRLYLFVSVSILFIILDHFSLLSVIRKPFDSVIIPVKKSIYQATQKMTNFSLIIREYSQIKSQNGKWNAIISENDQLKEKVRLLTEENIKYRQQLDSPLPSSFKFIPSQVISLSRYMEIWSGSQNGVASGMTVVDRDVYIGKIIKVTPLRSLVLMPYDKDSMIPVKTSRGTKGNVTGANGTTIVMDKILQKDQLFLDDSIVTTGEGGYPPNLLIGKIKHIDADDVSVYKQAQIAPIIDFNSEETVFVVNAL